MVVCLAAVADLTDFAAPRATASAVSRKEAGLLQARPPHGALVHPRRIPVFGPTDPAATYGYDSAVSPDGRNVYLEAYGADVLSVLRRDPVTRRLSLLHGRGACIITFRSSSRLRSCTPGPLGAGLTVTPDGRD